MSPGFATDAPSEIDPLVAAGPPLPVENLRPALKLQRVLIIDEGTPKMADLATGDIRPWENGPPVAVPMASLPFSLSGIELLQVQVQRDLDPGASNATLVSLSFGNAVVDVVQTRRELVIRSGTDVVASGPIGGSPAVVVDIVLTHVGDVRCSARNAETLTGIDATIAVESLESVTLTIGGPTAGGTGHFGQLRHIPAHVAVVRAAPSTGGIQRAATGTRRKLGALKNRVR